MRTGQGKLRLRNWTSDINTLAIIVRLKLKTYGLVILILALPH